MKNDVVMCVTDSRGEFMGVTIIPATKPDLHNRKQQERKVRVGVYCRVSTASAEQLHSYHHQIAYYIKKVKNEDQWELVDVYADEGITGTKSELRDEFNRMIQDCYQGKIDLVIVKSISRFARNVVDCLTYVRELRALNVDVYFEKENIHGINPASEFILSIHAMHAQEQSISMSNNLRWSAKKRMKQGTWLPNYVGYGFIIEEDMIMKDKEVAWIIDKIKKLYLKGFSLDEIVAQLEKDNIKSPKGKENWNAPMINLILTDPMYRGELIAQKTYSTDTFPFERKRNCGERERYRYLDDHEPYINKNESNIIDEMMLKRRSFNGIEKNTQKYQNRNYLSGLVKCEICGSNMKRCILTNGNKKSIGYQCVQHIKDSKKCSNKTVLEKTIQTAFLKCFNKLIDNISLLEEYLEDLEVLYQFTKKHPYLMELNQQNENIKKQIYETADCYNQGIYKSAFYVEQINRLKKQQHQIQEEIEVLKGESTYFEKKRYTEKIIDYLRYADYLYIFDEDVFKLLIHHIEVSHQTTISFHLNNGLILQEKVEV